MSIPNPITDTAIRASVVFTGSVLAEEKEVHGRESRDNPYHLHGLAPLSLEEIPHGPVRRDCEEPERDE